MMDNATFRANMNAAAVAEGNMLTQAQEPGIHDLFARQIRDNLFGPSPMDGNSCEKTIGCAKDAIEDSIERFTEANDTLRYIVDHL